MGEKLTIEWNSKTAKTIYRNNHRSRVSFKENQKCFFGFQVMSINWGYSINKTGYNDDS